VSYFAVALSRADSSWTGEEIDLDGVEDIDGLMEVATATASDAAAPVLVAVEEDDEWLALVRFDGDGDARVFLSDARVLATSDIAGIFADALEVADPESAAAADDEADDDDEENSGVVLAAEPGGDTGLLSDLGTTANELLALCAKEGALPGDITATVCERAGCGDVYDALRTS
jgi:putative tRNA adenosine deaminase-associated protein